MENPHKCQWCDEIEVDNGNGDVITFDKMYVSVTSDWGRKMDYSGR